jgi:hypothetical protein
MAVASPSAVVVAVASIAVAYHLAALGKQAAAWYCHPVEAPPVQKQLMQH